MTKTVVLPSIEALERAMTTWPFDSTSVVWDLGAYEGHTAGTLLKLYGCRIYAFEPQVEMAKRLHIKFPKAEVFSHGVGVESGKFEMAMVGTDFASFVFGEGWTQRGEGRLVEVAKIMRNLSYDEIDLMVMNIEGYEYLLLPHMVRQGLLPKIRFVQVATHPRAREGLPCWEDIMAMMETTHFMYWQYGYQWVCWARHGEEPYEGQA